MAVWGLGLVDAVTGNQAARRALDGQFPEKATFRGTSGLPLVTGFGSKPFERRTQRRLPVSTSGVFRQMAALSELRDPGAARGLLTVT
jgi:hypothetical protein